MDKRKQGVSILGLTKIFSILVLLLSLVSLFDATHRYFELAVHFKFQYLISAILFLGIFLFFKQKGWSLAIAVVVILNAYFVVPMFLSAKSAIALNQLTKVKLIHSNVQTSNTAYNKLIDLVKLEAPDLLITQEVNQTWLNELRAVKKWLPYQVTRAREDNFGIAVYSRFPLVSSEFIYFAESTIPSIKVTLAVGSQLITLITSHPLPPLNQSYYQSRNEQIEAIAELAKSIQTPLVVVGDLNVTPWSVDYSPLTTNTGLVNTRRGLGVLPTWPSHFIPAMIPIDHCLVSSEFQTIEMRVAGDVGSDHLPLIVTLGIL